MERIPHPMVNVSKGERMKDIGSSHAVRCAEKKCLGFGCPYYDRCEEAIQLVVTKKENPPRIILSEEKMTEIPQSSP